jgi:hypothetical protein
LVGNYLFLFCAPCRYRQRAPERFFLAVPLGAFFAFSGFDGKGFSGKAGGAASVSSLLFFTLLYFTLLYFVDYDFKFHMETHI